MAEIFSILLTETFYKTSGDNPPSSSESEMGLEAPHQCVELHVKLRESVLRKTAKERFTAPVHRKDKAHNDYLRKAKGL